MTALEFSQRLGRPVTHVERVLRSLGEPTSGFQPTLFRKIKLFHIPVNYSFKVEFPMHTPLSPSASRYRLCELSDVSMIFHPGQIDGSIEARMPYFFILH